MTTIDNQPIVFDLAADACQCDNIGYKQIVDFADVTQFQVKLDICASATNIISNGAFNDNTDWTTTGFSFTDNTACATSGGNVALWQTAILTSGKLYLCEFNVDSIGDGCTLTVQFGNTNVVTTITSSGKHRVTGFAWDDGVGSVLSDALIFIVTGADICISNVTMFEIGTNTGFAIKDSNGTIVAAEWLQDYVVNLTDGVGITGYAVESDYFELGGDGILTCKVNWAELGITTKGCYTIGLLDACDQEIYTYDLCTSGDWTEAAPLGAVTSTNFDPVIGQNYVCAYTVNGSGTGTQGIIYNAAAFINSPIRLRYTLTGSNFSVQAYTSIDNGEIRTTEGTFTETLSGIIGADSLGFYFSAATNAAWTVTITCIGVHVADEDLTTQHDSIELKLGSFDCGTILLQTSSDADVFDLSFTDNSFMPSIRVDGQLDRAQFKMDRRVQENVNGRFRNTYFQRYKDYRLYVAPVSEYVHNFLSLLPGYDHMYIDGVEYIVSPDQEYLVNYDGSDFSGSVSIDVRKKEELVRNQVCGPESNATAPSPVFLVDEETGQIQLTGESASDNLLAENQ